MYIIIHIWCMWISAYIYTIGTYTCRNPRVWQHTSGILHLSGIHRLLPENLGYSGRPSPGPSDGSSCGCWLDSIGNILEFLGYWSQDMMPKLKLWWTLMRIAVLWHIGCPLSNTKLPAWCPLWLFLHCATQVRHPQWSCSGLVLIGTVQIKSNK